MAKLLLVEDDNNLREIYEARLQAEGYTIVSARDGEEALVVAKAEKPDLVISDVMMPKISGFEMLDILRNTDGLKDVKVIMLTALGQSDDQKRADKLGADRYLVKSQVTLEDIVKTAHELLGDTATEAAAPAAEPAAAPAASPAPAPEPVAAPAATPAAEPVVEEPQPQPASVEEPKSAPAAETTAPSVEPAAASPAPAPEPVAAPAPAEEPKPEPAAASAAPQPAAGKAASEAKASDEAAKPAAQEEADMEAKIEDFVAGASSEPTAPAPPPGGTTSTAAADDTAADQPKKDDAATASDDKLMADAVDKLMASTNKDTAKPAVTEDKPEPAAVTAPTAPPTNAATPKATSIPVSVVDDKPAQPAPEPPEPPAPAATPAAEPKPEAPKPAEEPKVGPAKPSGSMGHDKVIQPPEETEHKKDIQELLAEEEAKEVQGVPGAVVGGPADNATEDKPSGSPAPSPSEAAAEKPGGVDPNSIAL